ncbi:MAG TPA: sporulation integral membrane protein YtvI [Symbiobacteriaceae bacterium]|nr:sporulation integral membrane protein YtvI [Symbiobacteriaceae bacterium]
MRSQRTIFLDWVYSLLILAGFLVAVWALYTYALPWILPFVVALVLAELMHPLVSRLSKLKRVSRSLAVGLVLFVAMGIILTGLTALTAELVSDLKSLADAIPSLYTDAVALSQRLTEAIGAFHTSLPTSMQDFLQSGLNELQSSLSGATKQLTGVLTVFSSLPTFLLNVVIAFMATFYIARDRTEINRFLLGLFPVEWRPQLRQVKQEVWSSTMGYAKAQLMVILIATIYSITVLSVLRVPYAVLMGVLVGVADVLPLLGPGAIYVPWAAYSAFTGEPKFAILLIVVWGIQAVIRQVIEPKLVGEQMGLHPLVTLFAIYMGFQVFGALGVVLGPIVVTLLKAVVRSGLLPVFREGRPF